MRILNDFTNDSCIFCIREKLCDPFFDFRKIFYNFFAVIARKFNFQICRAEIIAYVIIQIRSTRNFIKEHNLRYQILVIRNDVSVRIIFIQRTVHFLYDFCDRRNPRLSVGNFCLAQFSDSLRKNVHFFENLRIFNRVLIRIFNQNFVIVLASKLAPCDFQKTLDIRCALAHHIRVVHVHFDFENPRNHNSGNNNRKNHGNPFFVEDCFSHRFNAQI